MMAVMVDCRKTSVDTAQVGLDSAPPTFHFLILHMEEYSFVENFDEWVKVMNLHQKYT